MTTKKTDGPLSRWSQRKMLVQEGQIPAEPQLEADPDTQLTKDAKNTEMPEQEVLGETDEQQGDEADEPQIDEEKFANIDYEALDYDSDYTQFMTKNVPQMVQRRALRALWSSDPVFSNLDGLNDYDEDFTNAGVLAKGIESAWNVGKGYMTAEDEEVEAETETAEVAQADEGEPADAAAAHDDVAESETADDDETVDVEQVAEAPLEDLDVDFADDRETS